MNLELIAAVVHGSDSAEAVLQRLVHLLVPLAVPDHLLLLGKVLALAHWHRAVEVLPVVHVLAGDEAALEARSKALEVAGVVGDPLLARHHAHPLGSQHVRWQRGHAWRSHVIQNESAQKLVKASSTFIARHDEAENTASFGTRFTHFKRGRTKDIELKGVDLNKSRRNVYPLPAPGGKPMPMPGMPWGRPAKEKR